MKKQSLKTLYHSVYNLTYHLVLVTKYRRNCITKSILQELSVIVRALCAQWKVDLLEFNGESDHIHMLISLNPKIAPAIFVNNLKTVSSRLVRKKFSSHLKDYYTKPVFWSRSYCIVSSGGAPLTILKNYIAQQAAPL